MIDGSLIGAIVDEVKSKIKNEICFDEKGLCITPRLIHLIILTYYEKRYIKFKG